MRPCGILPAAAGICVALSGCSESVETAYDDDKAQSIRLCLAAVSKRTGDGNVSVVRTNSKYQHTTVYVGVGSERNQYRCGVIKNGPDVYYIQGISRV